MRKTKQEIFEIIRDWEIVDGDNWEKGEEILAEFISESSIYTDRVLKFVVHYEENGW